MCSGQVSFYEKNYIDLSASGVEFIIDDSEASNFGEDFVSYVRNRNNDSGWATTGSNDAGNTTIEVTWADDRVVNALFLVMHNFKSFTVKYWDGSAWADFSTAINETSNTDATTYFNFDNVTTSKLKIVINGTFVADEDKFMRQLIITKLMGDGQFEGWPQIKSPEIRLNKIVNKALSGKVSVADQTQAFSCELAVSNWNSDRDLTIVEEIYFKREGVLIWLNADTSEQFSSLRIGYRPQDIFLIRPINEYRPEWAGYLYNTGMKINMKLSEAID